MNPFGGVSLVRLHIEKCNESVNIILNKTEEGSVILLYGAKNEKFNNAVALKEYLDNIKK